MSIYSRKALLGCSLLAIVICMSSCGSGGDGGSAGGGSAANLCVTSGEPRISKITGKISNGDLITITGSGFGNCGPNVVTYDDFEKGTNGNSISTGVGSAQVGQWDAIGENSAGIKYSNAYRRSGSLSYVQDWSSNNGAEGGRWIGINSLGGATQIYFSWWAYIPSGVNVPGTERGAADPGGGPNWKTFWLYHNPFPASDYTANFITNSLPSVGAWFVGWLDDVANPQRLESGWGSDPSFIKGQWSRWEVYLAGSTSSSGVMQFFETNADNARYAVVDLTGVTIHSGETWDILHFPGYGRGDPHSQTYYDDIYVATGAGALARVELGNNSTYTSCTNLAVITHTTWSDSSITASVRLGSFSAPDNAYLFVINALGAVSEGFAVTIGNSY